jgi:hypothetical protein
VAFTEYCSTAAIHPGDSQTLSRALAERSRQKAERCGKTNGSRRSSVKGRGPSRPHGVGQDLPGRGRGQQCPDTRRSPCHRPSSPQGLPGPAECAAAEPVELRRLARPQPGVTRCGSGRDRPLLGLQP